MATLIFALFNIECNLRFACDMYIFRYLILGYFVVFYSIVLLFYYIPTLYYITLTYHVSSPKDRYYYYYYYYYSSITSPVTLLKKKENNAINGDIDLISTPINDTLVIRHSPCFSRKLIEERSNSNEFVILRDILCFPTKVLILHLSIIVNDLLISRVTHF